MTVIFARQLHAQGVYPFGPIDVSDGSELVLGVERHEVDEATGERKPGTEWPVRAKSDFPHYRVNVEERYKGETEWVVAVKDAGRGAYGGVDEKLDRRTNETKERTHDAVAIRGLDRKRNGDGVVEIRGTFEVTDPAGLPTALVVEVA